MNEEQVKKRGWIKNAVIVFLSVMLVLTFFSNTFMNRSLAEVSTKYVTSGEITTQVRGGGTVTANENYNVTLPQTRTVESVKVKVGDEVNEGDVLFTLSGNVSDELRAAEDRVYELNLAYQKALITAATGEGTQGDRDIQRAKEDLEIAQADYNSYSNNGQISKRQAKAEMDSAQGVLDAANAEVAKLEKELSGLNPGSDGGGGSYAPVTAAKAELDAAQQAVEANRLLYETTYLELVKNVYAYMESRNLSDPMEDAERGSNAKLELDYLVANASDKRSIENKNSSSAYWKKGHKYLPATLSAAVSEKGLAELPVTEEQKTAYKALQDAASKRDDAQNSYDSAYDSYFNSQPTGNSVEYNRVKKALEKATDAQTTAEAAFKSKQTVYNGIDESTTALNTAITNLEKLEQDAKIAALDLDSQRRQIARAQEELAELQHDSTEPEVRAKVSGIIGELNVTAGKEAQANETLCTITVPDMGYNVSITVTSEQARMVRVGEEASIANNWRGDLSATVSNIKTDPKNPQSSKIITFDIKGEVEPGTTLNLTVGSRGSQYDTIVPNSALRSDSNGDFVLVVTSRNSPLGNRYIATRVNVEKKASDDNNTAVTGELNAYDYVITTSSKPIKDKDMVRLAGE